jgi:hypothetical protein
MTNETTEISHSRRTPSEFPAANPPFKRTHSSRRLGEILKASEKRTAAHSTGGGSKGSKRELLPSAPPMHAQLGIDKKVAARAQALADESEPAAARPATSTTRKKLKPRDAPRVHTFITPAKCPKCGGTKFKSYGRSPDGGLYSFCKTCLQIVVHFRFVTEHIQSD